MSLLHSPKYSLHQNVSYRNEEGKNTPCHRRATLDLGWVNKAGKNQSKSFYQPNPKPRAFPVVCKAEGEPGGATQGGQAGTPHPSEHGTRAPWAMHGMLQGILPCLRAAIPWLWEDTAGLCRAAGASPGLPRTHHGLQHPAPFLTAQPEQSPVPGSQQPSQVVTDVFAPSRKHRTPFPPNRSLQSRALGFAPAQTGAAPGKARAEPLNLDPSSPLCKGGGKVWDLTVFFKDQKHKKDENNLRWALDSFSPAPAKPWGTRSCHPRWLQVTKQPQTGILLQHTQGLSPHTRALGVHSTLISTCPLPTRARAPPDPPPGDRVS